MKGGIIVAVTLVVAPLITLEQAEAKRGARSSYARLLAPAKRARASRGGAYGSRSAYFGGGFVNCSVARAAGAAPVYRGSPGYAPHLDRDNDGVGCE